MSSSPKNDALVYLSSAEVEAYLDEAQRLGTREIEFTGGEPFMNREIIPMLESALARGFEVLVLTNAMRPMRRFEAALEGLASASGEKLTLRVSLDHYTKALHEAERGPRSWDKVIDGLKWLSGGGFRIAVAGRTVPGESEVEALAGYTELFKNIGIMVGAGLVLFPQTDASADVPEISEACWTVLDIQPASMMCASSRMVVRRKGSPGPVVFACTLLP